MRVPAEIAIFVECSAWAAALPEVAAVCRRSARAALAEAPEGAGLRRLAELSIVLADDRYARALNRGYRGKDSATNVLSFPALAPAELGRAGGRAKRGPPLLLGDVVLAFETVRAEALAARKPLAHHLAHLIVHGTLHLLGYDHARAAEAERMERRETAILARLGIPDPYAAERRAAGRTRAAARMGADG